MQRVPAKKKGYLAGKAVSASTFQREFELDDVLEYVKTGIGSIIEDEVTQRFNSEELKVLLYYQISHLQNLIRNFIRIFSYFIELEPPYSH